MTWTITAAVVLALSFVGLTDPAMATSTRIVLSLRHLVVGATVILGLTTRCTGTDSR